MTTHELPLAPDGDPDHPAPEGCARHVLDEHQHAGRHDRTDEWVVVAARAVTVDCCGPAVELGEWSFSPDEARLLASSLALLADVAAGAVRPGTVRP